ncbi:hypothetical protein DKX38_018266 [Salix brachista]|uniref:RRM domain-containing protein n=1 Tax=Salix brachista TaxID=2182728 RepID=A0A5N5KNC4_9ROSI|nr:hypothetical protein DKX38_018266 [Salix brachista]
MADSYWRYAGDSRQPPPQSMSSLTGKRPRIDYDGFFVLKYMLDLADIPSSRDLSSFYSRDDDRGALQVIRDSDSIGASYDRYLRSGTISSYGGGQTVRAMSGVPSRPIDDTHLVSMGAMDSGASVKDRSLRMESGRPEVSLPPDASSTLFVEGLPSDCTRREVSRILPMFTTYIFRPFVGYKEVRLVSKESRHPGGDLLVLCFVDFLSPAHAATAMDALQGYEWCSTVFDLGVLNSDDERYRFDDHDRDSFHLRLQFARYPGARICELGNIMGDDTTALQFQELHKYLNQHL